MGQAILSIICTVYCWYGTIQQAPTHPSKMATKRKHFISDYHTIQSPSTQRFNKRLTQFLRPITYIMTNSRCTTSCIFNYINSTGIVPSRAMYKKKYSTVLLILREHQQGGAASIIINKNLYRTHIQCERHAWFFVLAYREGRVWGQY